MVEREKWDEMTDLCEVSASLESEEHSIADDCLNLCSCCCSWPHFADSGLKKLEV